MKIFSTKNCTNYRMVISSFVQPSVLCCLPLTAVRVSCIVSGGPTLCVACLRYVYHRATELTTCCKSQPIIPNKRQRTLVLEWFCLVTLNTDSLALFALLDHRLSQFWFFDPRPAQLLISPCAEGEFQISVHSSFSNKDQIFKVLVQLPMLNCQQERLNRVCCSRASLYSRWSCIGEHGKRQIAWQTARRWTHYRRVNFQWDLLGSSPFCGIL